MKKLVCASAFALSLAFAASASAQVVDAGATNGQPPANTVGANGDMFLDLNWGNLYGPKAGGAWPTTAANNVMPYSTTVAGADPTGVADSTTAFQNAVYSGAIDVYIPPGLYRVCNVVLPTTQRFRLHGAGTATVLYSTPNTCPRGVFQWQSRLTIPVFGGQELANFEIDGTNYKYHLIDGLGIENIDYNNLYINNLPAGFDGIYVQGISGYVARDVRINGLRAYQDSSLPLANALIEFGQYSGDSSVNNVDFAGNGKVNNGIYINSGAADIHVSGSHLYNTLGNVLYTAGSWSTFNDNVFDYSYADDIVEINGGLGHNTFTGNYFQGVAPGYSGVQMNSAYFNNFVNNHVICISGSCASAVKDDSASAYNVVSVLDPGGLSNYAAPISMVGTGDAYGGIPGVSNYATSNMPTTGTGGNYVCLNSSGTFYRKTSCP